MQRRLRILIVEDEDLVRDVAAHELRNAGFDVIEAATGQQAIQVIGENDGIDALFTDIRLGAGPDGWDVAAAFRSVHPDDPVIYASGYVPGEDRRMSNSLFFPKPYRPSRITAALRLMTAASRWVPVRPSLGANAVPEAGAALMRLTYMSRPTELARLPSPGEAMARLGQQCHALNRSIGLSGALLIGEEWFIQVLEGERDAVLAALGRINRDPRHEDLRIFELTAAPGRLFGPWAMHVGTVDTVEPDLLWRCIEGFRQPGPHGADVLIEALAQSVRAAA